MTTRRALILCVLCFAASARAQQQQHVDSLPAPTLWVRANTPSHAGVHISYLSPDTCWGSCADSGLLMSTDGGMNWVTHRFATFNPSDFFRTKREGWLVSGPSVELLARTEDAGNTWQTQSFPLQGVSGITQVDSLRTFLADGQGIARTTDAGKTWTVTSLPGYVGKISFCDIAHGYAIGGDPSYCFKTTDSGSTWEKKFTGLTPSPFQGVQGLSVITPSIVVIAEIDSIMRTTDGGTHWNLSLAPAMNRQTQGIMAMAIRGAIGYAVGPPGFIIRTIDSAKTWVQEQSGVSGYLYSPAILNDSIAACTGDGGLILIRNPSLAGIHEERPDSFTVSVFPNPAQSAITIEYSLAKQQHVNLQLFDVNGNLISNVLNSAMQNAGRNVVKLPTTELANGTYFIQFSSEKYTASSSFAIQK